MIPLYRRNGEKVEAETDEEWIEYFREVMEEGDEGRRVDYTIIDVGDEEVHVSTVFLQFDYSFGQGERPILFETMIFGGKHDRKVFRYSSEEDAQGGHELTVSAIKVGAGLWEDHE